jgi:arginase family enzyme
VRSLILDLDESIGSFPGALRLDLADWHDTLRFACSRRSLSAFAALLPAASGPVFLGSGDFHHLTLPLVARIDRQGLRVLVFDNHPDNMRFPFGVHCGSWVARVAALPTVARVDVVGITSTDIGRSHAWENHLAPLYRGRLRYWSTGVDVGWTRRIGLEHAVLAFDSIDDMLAALQDDLGRDRSPVYVSIDKDVLDPGEATSNWDQGRMRVADLVKAIDAVRPRLVASDVTGEISIARYPQRWKRWLAALDRQPDADPASLPAQQARQHVVNQALWQALTR